MSSFFQKARERAQEAAAQFQQQHHPQQGAEDGEGATKRNSFTYTGALPHLLRHGVASVDPRYEFNRSFHILSGKLKALRIDNEAMARETEAVATTTCRWGQDQLPHKREDGAGDEALADMADRLAYIFELVSELQRDHAKRLEKSRRDFKRIQEAESELAPRRAARVKLHKELMTLLPERAKMNSTKIAPLETQLATLEADDKPLEEELGRLKREALKSSYDAHFDSMIELGEKTALLARYGKLITSVLPVYSQPFPTPRHQQRGLNEHVWPGEPKLAEIQAAVEPALQAFKPDFSLPSVQSLQADSASTSSSEPPSRRQTMRFSEMHKQQLDKVMKEEEEGVSVISDSHDSSVSGAVPMSHPNLPMGGSLPPNLNMGPSPMQGRSTLGATSPGLPPRPVHEGNDPTLSSSLDAEYNNAPAAGAGPTLAETGSPIVSTSQGPGPKTGVLSPRIKSPQAATLAPVPVPALSSAAMTSSEADAQAKKEKEAQEQAQVTSTAVAARIRRDGTIVRRGDADWSEAQHEDLPPYHE